jgi:hypothetical protein
MPATILLQDRFQVGTNGSLINTGTPDLGAGWTLTGNISYDRAGTNSIGSKSTGANNSLNLALMDCGQADVVATALSCPVFAGNGGLGVIVRATDANNCWLCYCDGNARFSIYKRVAGTFTELTFKTATGFVNDQIYQQRIVVSSTTISVWINGKGMKTDEHFLQSTGQSFNQTATLCGIYLDGTPGQRCGDFLVTTIEAAFDPSTMRMPASMMDVTQHRPRSRAVAY